MPKERPLLFFTGAPTCLGASVPDNRMHEMCRIGSDFR